MWCLWEERCWTLYLGFRSCGLRQREERDEKITVWWIQGLVCVQAKQGKETGNSTATECESSGIENCSEDIS
jgi:hypothetical protein